MNHGIELKTTPFNDGRIIQELYEIRNGIKDQIWRKVLNTADEQIRQALIELGWTPPKQSPGA